ncbi:hypothetical protein B0H14DRAFT_3861614 [Mycena olivaceomarginata]|nr:hypothetical protein B0H14DRAFT_3861614 [Mycena olivaceomarginata]
MSSQAAAVELDGLLEGDVDKANGEEGLGVAEDSGAAPEVTTLTDLLSFASILRHSGFLVASLLPAVHFYDVQRSSKYLLSEHIQKYLPPLANPISRKRKRELLDYVSVPPMPTAGGEKENALAASASDRDGKYRKGGNRSRKTKTGAGGKVHLSLEDAINTASAQNDRAGLILVPNAIGQAKRR